MAAGGGMATTQDNHVYEDLDSIPDDSNYETVVEGYTLPEPAYIHLYNEVPEQISQTDTSVTYSKDPDLILPKRRARRNEGDDAQVKDARGPRQCPPWSCRMPCWAVVLIVIGLFILIAVIVGIVLLQAVFLPRGPGTNGIEPTEMGPRNLTVSVSTTRTPISTLSSSQPAHAQSAGDRFGAVFTETRNSKSSSAVEKMALAAIATVQECQVQCVDSRTFCYGLDYSRTSQTCFLIHTVGYELQPIGKIEGTDNYRRILTANGTCDFWFNTDTDRRILLDQVTRQPSNINTLELCKQQCLGSAQDASLASGETCYGVSFDPTNNVCYLSSSFRVQTEPRVGWQFVRLLVVCTTSVNPGCLFRYTKSVHMEVSMAVQVDRTVLHGVHDVPACAAICSNYQYTHGVRCQAFQLDRGASICTAFSGFSGQLSLVSKQGVDIYHTGSYNCVNCEDLYTPSVSVRGSEGIRQNGTFTLFTCKYRCDVYERQADSGGRKCYGFDITSTTGECHVLTTEGFTVTNFVGSSNYRRQPICRACREPTRYASTINTFPPGGVAFTGNSIDSVYWCVFLCQDPSVSPTSDTCFGFSFNKRTKQCHLYRSFDYDVGSIGSSPDVDHYRRQYSCPSSPCKYAYTTRADMTGGRGVLQPADLNTVERCLDRCYGYVIATFGSTECYGVDFHLRSTKCTIFTALPSRGGCGQTEHSATAHSAVGVSTLR